MHARPLVAYTHRVPAVGPALLRETCDVLEAPDDASPTHDGIVARVRDADALCFFVPDRIDAALLDALPRMRVLAGFGKGYDNVDLAAARARDIVVTNVPFGLTEATADLAWALLLGLARRVAQADAFVRAATLPGWHPSRLFGARVHGATLGIYGFGEIGRAIARRAMGFSMSVRYYDVRRAALAIERACDAAYLECDALVRASDYLVLAAMPAHARLINVARGSLVDESAIADALAAGTIAGYASDVFACEDRHLADRPRALEPRSRDDVERTLFTPHLGTATVADREELARVRARCVLAALAGCEAEGRL